MVRGASLQGALGCTLLALILGSSSSVDLGAQPAGFFPRFNPFFFLCTHHGELEGAGLAEGGVEVLLTFQVTGNPTAYTPGQEYQGERIRPSCPSSLHPGSIVVVMKSLSIVSSMCLAQCPTVMKKTN